MPPKNIVRAIHFHLHITFHLRLCVLAFLCAVASESGPLSSADPNLKPAARELVELLRRGEERNVTKGESIFVSIPNNSPARPIAAQALALLQIQDKQYSKAWNTLASADVTKGVDSSLSMGHLSLKFWLLLQARSKRQAEDQCKQIVVEIVRCDPKEPNLPHVAGYLGRVLGMLRLQDADACVTADVQSKSRTALVGMKPEVARRFQEELESSVAWGEKLRDMWTKLESMDLVHRNSEQDNTAGELEGMKRTQNELLETLKKSRTSLASLEKYGKELKSAPAISMPQMPVRPTQDKDESDNAYDRRLKSFMNASATYPERLAKWETTQKKRQELFDKNIAFNQTKIENERKVISKTQEALEELEQTIARRSDDLLLTKIVCEQLQATGSSVTNLFQPASFKLIDHKQEVSRLDHSLRMLK